MNKLKKILNKKGVKNYIKCVNILLSILLIIASVTLAINTKSFIDIIVYVIAIIVYTIHTSINIYYLFTEEV